MEPGVRSAEALIEARHEITAEVVYARDDLVMLDFGLLAYSDARAPTVVVPCVGPTLAADLPIAAWSD